MKEIQAWEVQSGECHDFVPAKKFETAIRRAFKSTLQRVPDATFGELTRFRSVLYNAAYRPIGRGKWQYIETSQFLP